MNPVLSIVIANYNYGRFLEEAIQSVVFQDMGDLVELIICDAASTDNSVEIIKKYANGLPPNTPRSQWSHNDSKFQTSNSNLITWWCSEKDGGQSAAFNKGFAQARGRFLTWLNADDVMLPGTLKKLKTAIEHFPTCEWFVGGVLWLDPQMRIIRCGRGRPFSNIRYRTGDVSVWGPSSFFTKRLLNEVGGVDERFFYTMDTDLWLRFALKAGARYLPFTDYAWGLRLHPNAKMSGHNFAEEGNAYVGGLTGSGEKSAEKMQQLEQEVRWKREYFKAVRINLFLRLISVSWFRAICGYIDTFLYKNKCYKEISK